MNNLNIFDLCKPGIYEIRCLKNNKVYIGQSHNCAYRIARHSNDLKQKTHHCEPLLEDFLKYGINYFKAKIIMEVSLDGKFDNNYLIQLETKYISELEPLSYYNIINSNQSPSYKSYKYKGQVFNTIKDLREFINNTTDSNYSETHFKRLFLNKNSPYYNEVDYVGEKPQTNIFSIEGKYYSGWKEIVNVGLAKTKSQVFYRLNSSNYKNWFRLKKTKKSNSKKNSLNGYLIKNIYYNNAYMIVSAGLAEDINQVYYRVSSSNSKWKDWKKSI